MTDSDRRYWQHRAQQARRFAAAASDPAARIAHQRMAHGYDTRIAIRDPITAVAHA